MVFLKTPFPGFPIRRVINTT